eukprot:TRINITY_DN89580_c0_g1_i1.p1 TRINITY_DN89580_c0_g1~~TRINITY_DN89580_c0_g1_i1.p1  ORF type:complete len:216 (+),score=22.01 TRINITY_DN89580_c0_g1_i1:2-649(+)
MTAMAFVSPDGLQLRKQQQHLLELHIKLSEDGRLAFGYREELDRLNHLPGRNTGIIQKEEQLYVLTHLSPRPLVLSLNRSDAGPWPLGCESRGALQQSLQGMSNSVHLLQLANGKFLGMGHKHLKLTSVAKHGDHYAQYFLILGSDDLCAVEAISRPFCFPSLNYPGRCDIIQYVTSISWALVDKTSVNIAIGVNDCDHMVLQVELNRILEFIHG